MRKIFALLSIPYFLLISCSEESSSSQKNEHNEAIFVLSKNNERLTWNNIQVGETLKFDIKVQNFDSSADVVYILKPITTDATKHQQNKIDYYFQQEEKIALPSPFSPKDSVFIKKAQDSIIIKKSSSSFFVTVLKPGNFTQQYELRKMRLNKYVAGSTQELLFSAVKIDVYTWNEQTDNSTMFSSSKHSRYYEFTIDDGDQTNDSYLTNSDSKENIYQALYNNKKYDGSIIINKPMTFSEKVNTEKGAQVVPSWILSELKIIQKRNHEPDNIITYNDLTIKQK